MRKSGATFQKLGNMTVRGKIVLCSNSDFK
nr:MAG TPA: hypothetical protein [Caudoviricetes sp.]